MKTIQPEKISVWPDVAVEIHPARALGPVELDCRLTPGASGVEIQLTAINPTDADHEVAIRYPMLYYRFPEGTPLREFDPLFGGVLEKRNVWVERWYPGDASLCASFVTAPGRALGLAVRNDAQRRIRIYHLPGSCNGQMSMELERVLVRRGERLMLPSAYIAWGTNWGAVLRPYRDWLAQNYRRPQPLCDWYWNGRFVETRYAHCIAPTHPVPGLAAGAWVFDNAQPPRTFADVQAEIETAFTTLGARGLKPLFYQFGWWQSMTRAAGVFLHDHVSGDYTAHHATVRPIIEYLHARGGRTFLYTNFICAGEDSQVFREHPEFFARDAAGFPIRNASYPMFLFCPGAPGLREHWDAVLRHILLDLDADGLFLDQLGGGTPSAYCYDPAHRHDHPDVYGRDYLALLDWVCRRARELKPDCFLGGELTSDIRALWVDQMQGVGYSRPQQPDAEYFAFMSFINPEIAHLPSTNEYLARGCPGQPDNPLWQKYRDVFRAGLQPCDTDPHRAAAYLFGPVKGQAILATLAPADLPATRVTLPTGDIISVAAGPTPRFYLLEQSADGRIRLQHALHEGESTA